MQHIYDKTPSYWCTWSTQNWVAEDKKVRENNFDSAAFLGAQGAQLTRAEMNEDNIFRSGGWRIFIPKYAAICFLCLTTDGTFRTEFIPTKSPVVRLAYT